MKASLIFERWWPLAVALGVFCLCAVMEPAFENSFLISLIASTVSPVLFVIAYVLRGDIVLLIPTADLTKRLDKLGFMSMLIGYHNVAMIWCIIAMLFGLGGLIFFMDFPAEVFVMVSSVTIFAWSLEWRAISLVKKLGDLVLKELNK